MMSDYGYLARCQRIADAAMAAGLPVEGLIHPDLGWEPGIVVKLAFTNRRVETFATEHGYKVTPSGRAAIIEERSDA